MFVFLLINFLNFVPVSIKTERFLSEKGIFVDRCVQIVDNFSDIFIIRRDFPAFCGCAQKLCTDCAQPKGKGDRVRPFAAPLPQGGERKKRLRCAVAAGRRAEKAASLRRCRRAAAPERGTAINCALFGGIFLCKAARKAVVIFSRGWYNTEYGAGGGCAVRRAAGPARTKIRKRGVMVWLRSRRIRSLPIA